MTRNDYVKLNISHQHVNTLCPKKITAVLKSIPCILCSNEYLTAVATFISNQDVTLKIRVLPWVEHINPMLNVDYSAI